MEFLRFGSHIPGAYWGCCACSVIQNFKVDPDTKWSSQVQYGDQGSPVIDPVKQAQIWVGPTYKDIFLARLRIGEFDNRDMPSHAFFAILTEGQASGGVGKKWLAILREAGFEFLRTVDNSVYGGSALATDLTTNGPSPHKNYIFALFRNIGRNRVADQFTPPPEWTELPMAKEEVWSHIPSEDRQALTTLQSEQDKAIWDAVGPPKFYTEEEIEAAGAPVILCGLRDEDNPNTSSPAFPPQSKADRAANIAKRAEVRAAKAVGAAAVMPEQSDPFATEDEDDEDDYEDEGTVAISAISVVMADGTFTTSD